MVNVVSGARIAGGGLHLGHFLGCFQRLISMKDEIGNFYFVLNYRPSPNDKADLVMMLTDIYAIKIAHGLNNLHVVVDTDLILENAPFLDYLRKKVSLQNMLSIYPKNKNGTYQGSSISDFLFPIEQAATYFLYDATYAFLNDDNLRFVTFAGELAKKINNSQNLVSIKIPRLMTGNISHLCGYNYKKMSKANGNTIPLSDTKDDISKKLYKLFDMKALFEKYPSEKDRFCTSYPYIFPQKFLPFDYISAFFPNDKRFEYDLLKNSLNRKQFRTLLVEAIQGMLFPIWEIRRQLSPCDVLEFFRLDDQLSRNSVNKALNSLNGHI